MTWRAAAIGTVLAGIICLFAYVSRHVLTLPMMIGGQFPMIVFAVVVLLVLAYNPLARLVGIRWTFGAKDLAIVTIMGLSVCAFTHALYMRYFAGMTVLPQYAVQTNAGWQANRVMSYVPGYVGYVAEGQLVKPFELARRVVAEQDADTAAGRLWRATARFDRSKWLDASTNPQGESSYRDELAKLVNTALADTSFTGDADAAIEDRIVEGRLMLQREMPEFFAPPPPGSGILLNDGHYDAALMGDLLFGHEGPLLKSPGLVPWGAWWPVFRTWAGLMGLLVVISLCIAIIVRPQWSQHEQISFPIVMFAEMIATPGDGGGSPNVARSPLFWIGFGAVGLYLVNGLNAWFPNVPNVPMTLDFDRMRELFPNATQPWQSFGVFKPEINLTVIAFGFLLPRPISLTFGLTTAVFLFIASQVLAAGVATGGGDNLPFNDLMALGGMLAMVSFIFYTGRSYYRRVATAAIWPTYKPNVPVASVWAARVMFICLPLAVVHFGRASGSMLFAAAGIGVLLLLWVVNARIVAETGLYRVGESILPIGVVLAFFGPESVGPTQVIVLMMLSVLLGIDLWETPTAFLVTGVEFARRTGLKMKSIAPTMATTAILGLVLATGATIALQYHFGLLGRDEGVVYGRNTESLNRATAVSSRLAADDELVASVTATDLQRLAKFAPTRWSVGWTLFGAALFAGCSMLRLRVPWWPIHPVMFVLLGNWGVATFGFSFLLSWLIKTAIVGAGGAAMYRRVVPLMCGLITAGLVSAIGWMTVGVIYFAITGTSPPTFTVF